MGNSFLSGALITVVLCSDIFFCLPEPSFGFSIIDKYYLFSEVVQYIVLKYTSIYYSFSLSSVHSIFDRIYHKWSLTICDGCFDTLKSSKM